MKWRRMEGWRQFPRIFHLGPGQSWVLSHVLLLYFELNINWERGWMGPGACLDAVAKRRAFALDGNRNSTMWSMTEWQSYTSYRMVQTCATYNSDINFDFVVPLTNTHRKHSPANQQISKEKWTKSNQQSSFLQSIRFSLLILQFSTF
jgi:hypothetical protein